MLSLRAVTRAVARDLLNRSYSQTVKPGAGAIGKIIAAIGGDTKTQQKDDNNTTVKGMLGSSMLTSVLRSNSCFFLFS